MDGLTAVASGVGAGVSQVRIQRQASQPQMMEQTGKTKDVNTAVLRLITQALSASGAAGHDLDVLA